MHVKIFGPWTPCACCGTDYYQPCWVLKGGWVNRVYNSVAIRVCPGGKKVLSPLAFLSRQLYVFKNTWTASVFDNAFIENTHLREFTQEYKLIRKQQNR